MVSADNGQAWQLGGYGTDSRKIVVKNIVPIKVYLVDAYASTTGGDGPLTGKPITWSIRQ